MKKKLSVFLLLISLVFSGNGCFSAAAWGWWESTFLLWLLFINNFGFHDHWSDCGTCDPGCSTCDAYPAHWASTATTGPDASVYYSTAASESGIYAAGSITGNRLYDFGKAGGTSAGFAGGGNALLVKYEPDGTALWTATVSAAPDNTCFYSVSAGSDGIYAAGTMDGNGSFSFGDGVIVSGHYASGSNALLVKYDSSGKPLWGRSVNTGPDASSLYAVAAASDGIYVSGCIMGNSTYDFGNGVTATGAGNGSNAVVVKYGLNGTPLWARTIAAGPGDSCFQAIAVKGEYVFAAGYIAGDRLYDFGDSKTASGKYSSGPNVVMVKYSADGTVHWAESIAGGSNSSSFQSIAFAGEMVYAAGYITGIGQYDFGNGKKAVGGGNGPNAVLVQYSPAGVAQWARSVTTNPDNSCYTSVSAGSDGVYAAGFINGRLPYNFGNTMTVSGAYAGGPNVVLVKYNTAGTTQWAKSAESGRLESCFQSVAVSDSGIFSAGYMYGYSPYDFWNGLSVTGTFTGSNCVLVKY